MMRIWFGAGVTRCIPTTPFLWQRRARDGWCPITRS